MRVPFKSLPVRKIERPFAIAASVFTDAGSGRVDAVAADIGIAPALASGIGSKVAFGLGMGKSVDFAPGIGIAVAIGMADGIVPGGSRSGYHGPAHRS